MNWRRLRFALLLFFAAGCEGTGENSAWKEPRPLGANLQAVRPPDAPSDSDWQESFPAEPDGPISLRTALAAALLRNPRLASVSLDLRIREARSLQARQIPNPELGVEAEGFGGTGEHRAFDTAEYSIQLSQMVELGGKRGSRERVAMLNESLAGWDYETLRLLVMVETTLAFVDVMVAQEQVKLAEETGVLAQQLFDAVSERVKAGKDSPLEETKAAIERSNARIDLAAARRNLATARVRLAATWGSSAGRFSSVAGNTALMASLPTFESILSRVDRNPELARWSTEMEQRLAQLALERSGRIPDLTVSIGARLYGDTRDHSFSAGLSIPLPVFSRNQGGILEAEYELMKARQDRRAENSRVRAALAEAHEVLSAAHEEVSVLDSEILPAAQQAFDAARTGYQEGEFGFLEFLDAQRTLFQARQRRTESLSTYLKAVAVEESLIGTGLDTVVREEEQRKKEGKDDGK